jgi:alkanesulfonate monooxygenase SsuD/methylene tetrahydromethanopterin reductase-like flavin-dependent oxidoreductase (luciferase family)
MKVGIYITNQHTIDRDMVSGLDEQYAMVRLARDGGWDSLFTGHHYLNEGDNQQLQAIPFLSRLQAEAGEMTLGLGIFLLPLHNPVYVAETIASLDVICRGNFVFGVGLGYRELEFDAFRVPKGQRVKRFEECLALIQRLWTEDRVSHESEVCKLVNVHMNLRPVQKPRPPLWMAANGDEAVKRAARLADTWFINPQADLGTLKRQLDLYRRELKRLGKPAPRELPCFKEVFCAPTREQALELAAPFLAAKYASYASWGIGGVQPKLDAKQAFAALAKDRFVLGTPEDCYRELEPYAKKLGVNHFVLRTQWTGLPLSAALASMRLMNHELLPALRRL